MVTALDSYMASAGIKDAEFAVRIGRDRSIVNKLRRGVLRPTLDLAALIEAETAGSVAMQSWVADAPTQAAA